MYKSILTLLALVASSLAAPPEHIIEERHIISLSKRQADVSQLLQLASLAGITALPTDPAVLLSLGPLANSLASALPTSSVLSVLITAAPSGFVSSIVNDPSYASSFESAFAAGSSPSWFNGLPTGVKSYLHTYTGFGQLAGAAGAVKGAASATGSAMGDSESGVASGSATSGGSAMTSGASASSGLEAMTTSGASAGRAGSTTTAVATTTAASSGAAGSATSAAGGAGSTVTSAAGGGASSASSAGGAAKPTGAFAAGLAGVVGIMGAAFAAL